jgi:hypothetical protein
MRSGNEIDPDQDKKGKKQMPVHYCICCMVWLIPLQ